MTARLPRAVPLALAAVVSVGAVLRLLEYCNNRPLWIDEAMLALSIGMRGFRGLLSPLAYDQVTAPLFLWGIEAATIVGGMNEYALRLLPLLAGIVLPWMVWRAAIRIGGNAAGLIAATLAAISVPLVYFSAELKPYGPDALTCAGMMALTAAVLDQPARIAHWRRLLAGGAVAILVSVPAPFVLAGVGAALLTDAGTRGARRRWLGIAAVWTVLLAVLYLTFFRPAATPYLERFWAAAFLGAGTGGMGEGLYAGAHAVLDPLPPLPDRVAFRWYLLLAAAAVFLLVRRAGLSRSLLICVPVIATVVASGVGLYPLAPRLLLFLAPTVLVVCGVGLAELLSMIRLSGTAGALAGTALVLAWGMPGAWRNAQSPRIRSEGRDAVARIVSRAGPDPVYITSSGLPTWAMYSTDWSHPDTTRLGIMIRAGRADGPSAVNDLIEEASGPPLEPAVAGPGRLELPGRRSGLRYAEPAGFSQDVPDPEWAAREVDRMTAAARPYLWVYGAHWIEHELPDLLAEFSRRGIVVVESWPEVAAVALRIRVPRMDSAVSGAGPPDVRSAPR